MTNKKRIVAYVGDFYHKAEPARLALERSITERQAAEQAVLHFAEDTDELMTQLASNPAAVVLFAENRIDPEGDPARLWMTEKHAADIARYVEAGGGWLAWHSGLASYPEDGAYVRMLRGCFLSHPAEHQLVRYEPSDSPLISEPFELLDEHYFTACREEETEVFLRSSSIDGASIAGWRHPSGQGRVCCLTPAHREEGLADDAFLGALRAAVKWTAGL
ncbi:trehalose utilization [Paenibacillus nanensis]|uniref:Trehalose utilization n=1 Tax=Paenibacillus nanensis TaxID=393251 RepID=A0A3A1UWW9_9BACL|nr:ThuA domain-containing protein [Paenibacillus nanensis]RIX52695.1 trehalose utilization [Paenibacillus nanensis]